MWIVIRRHAPIVASLLFTWVAGCTLPDRPPTLADAGPANVEDVSSGDASRGDAVRGDVSLGDAPVDLRAADGIDVSVVDAPGPDGVVRDGPIVTIDARPDAPTVCIPGGTCLPANPCHQGESECRDGGGTTCRDTSRLQTNGTPCDKGVCLDGMCQACAAGTMCDVANKPCRVGTIVCSTGAPVCTETDNKANGATCGSGLVCQEGACKPCVTGETCTPTNACHAGKLDCSASAPTCNDTGMGVPPGASCGPDKVCNPAGTCVACVAGAMCTVATNACRSGTIACSTGAPVCIESGNTTDGTSCGMDKVCSGGTCVACSPGLSCVPANPCHAGKTVCSPAVSCTDTGMNLMDGADCAPDMVCSGGMCSPCVSGKDCPTTNPCKTGKTSCATGISQCIESGDQKDGYVCGMKQVCSKGVCDVCNTGDPCPPPNYPCHAGTLSCTTGTPVCNDTGMSLMDGVGCGPDLVCRGGNCVTCKAGDGCQPTDTCKTGTYSCATGSQVCVANGNKAPGAECEPGKVCTSAGVCDVCNNGGPCTPSSNVCHKGTLSCATGTGVCVDSGLPQDNGSNCGTSSVCYNGMCGLCRQGDPCTSTTSPCKNAAYVCSTGQQVCTDTTNKAPNTPCGAGQSCVNGRTTAAAVCNASGQCPTPQVTVCGTGFCDSAGTNCLDCGAQMACAGVCCSSGQGCCNNACTSLNGNDNCGVCGNKCTDGKSCSGTQCAWPDGHVCASATDCASGVCGGRCCPAGTSCECTQPSAANLIQNPGFDTNTVGWILETGSATVSWRSGAAVDADGVHGDAESCPYSGAAHLTCPLEGADACQGIGQCIPISSQLDYNFGWRLRTPFGSDRLGNGYCAINIYTGAACSGTETPILDDLWPNSVWSNPRFGSFNAGVNVSARISCRVDDRGSMEFDMVYLSRAPGDY